MNRLLTTSLLAVATLTGTACGKDQTSTPTGPGFAVTVQPLSLTGVNNAIYSLTVRNAAGVVWTKSGLESTRYGDGKGALTFVGPCDASQNPHSVELVLESLWGPTGQLSDFVNPAPSTAPAIRAAVTCAANGDTPVSFNLTIARDARQGFFDIGVTFSDIFCSAKLDCLDDPLLHIPGGERGPTAVMAFACTSGRDTQGNEEDTFLHMTCPWADAHHRLWKRPWARPPYRSGPLRPPPRPLGHPPEARRTRLRRSEVPRCRFHPTTSESSSSVWAISAARRLPRAPFAPLWRAP